jgi:hypothetical protein
MRFNYKTGQLPLIEEFMRTDPEPAEDEAAYLNEFYTVNEETNDRVPLLEVMARMRQRDFVEILYQFEHPNRQIDEASRDHALLAAAVAAGRLMLREAAPHPAEWGCLSASGEDALNRHLGWVRNLESLSIALHAASTVSADRGDMEKVARNRALAHNLFEMEKGADGDAPSYSWFCDSVADFSFQLMAGAYILENDGLGYSAAGYLVPIDDDGPMEFLMAAGAVFACACGIVRVKRRLTDGDENEANRLEAKLALDAARCVGLAAIVEVNAGEGVIDYAK